MRHTATLITVAYIVFTAALPAFGGADPEPDPAGVIATLA
jgi:hypothetical protein